MRALPSASLGLSIGFQTGRSFPAGLPMCCGLSAGLLLLAFASVAQAQANLPQLARIAPIPSPLANTDAVGLPDAPDAAALPQSPIQGSTQDSTQTGPSSIAGVIQDSGGAIIPGATIAVARDHSASAAAPLAVTTSSPSGQFTLAGLAPGIYRLSVSATNFQTYLSSPIIIHAAQQLTLSTIALPVAVATSDVQVSVTQVELAHEQVKAEEKQRLLGIVPDFYSSYLWNAAPLTAGQKFSLAARAIIDPVNILGNGATAGIQQWQNTYAAYGQGAQGYAKRYGADFTDGTIGLMLGAAVFPSILHQDPRYFYLGAGTKKQRLIYALTRSIITRGDNGKYQPNYSSILGDLSAGAISNAYHPASDRGIGLTFSNAALNILGYSISSLVNEFVLRHVVSGVPTYAQGKAQGPIPNALTP